MQRIALALAGCVALAAAPAVAQVPDSGLPPHPGSSGTEVLGSPSKLTILATTPSRIRSSRREMNRGRTTPFAVRMSEWETRRYADDLVDRAGFHCSVADALVVGRTAESMPVIEVYCGEGGGLVIADALPIQATDCLDFAPIEGEPPDDVIAACRLPANVALVAATRQSAARN